MIPENGTPLEQQQTFGQKAVWLSFNPSWDDKVGQVKQLYAQIIDLLNDLRADQRNEQGRLASVAITEAQGSQMRAVKAITWKD